MESQFEIIWEKLLNEASILSCLNALCGVYSRFSERCNLQVKIELSGAFTKEADRFSRKSPNRSRNFRARARSMIGSSARIAARLSVAFHDAFFSVAEPSERPLQTKKCLFRKNFRIFYNFFKNIFSSKPNRRNSKYRFRIFIFFEAVFSRADCRRDAVPTASRESIFARK